VLAFAAAIRTIHGTLSHAVLLPAALTRLYIARLMGHENAQMVYEIYATWIEEMNRKQVVMLHSGRVF
jgi:integrase